jgi:hypothetical protein
LSSNTSFTSSPIEDTPKGKGNSWYQRRTPNYPISRGGQADRGRGGGRGRNHYGNTSQQSNPGHSFNIEDYVSRDMIMDPWAELLHEGKGKQN